VLSLVLGLFLLVTAGLKIHGLYVDPYSQESILLTPRLLVALIDIEIVIGVWLLTGLAPCAAWLAALVFFALGAAANLYLALESQRSCGCFGTVDVNPWWTFGLDGAAVVALILLRPRLSDTATFLESISCPLKTALGAGALLTLVGRLLSATLFIFLALGCQPAVNHSPVEQADRYIEEQLAPVIADEAKQFTHTFLIRNDTSQQLHIKPVGHTCACSNVLIDRKEIDPGDETWLRLEADLSAKNGPQVLACHLHLASGQVWTYAVRHRERHEWQAEDSGIGEARRERIKELERN
jgi:hypothetical protein